MLRVLFGMVFLYAGLMKVFAFGADKFAATLSMLPVPLFWAWLVIIVEVIGGLFFILGLWVRWSSVFLLINMIVAFLMTVLAQGLTPAFAPFFGIAGTLALLFWGAGKWSLERAAFGKEY